MAKTDKKYGKPKGTKKEIKKLLKLGWASGPNKVNET